MSLPLFSRMHVGRRLSALTALPTDQEGPHTLGLARLPLPGWNMLELEAEGEMPHGLALVTLETRKGAVEVGVPLRAGKTAKRLVFVPFGVRRASLQAVNAPGQLRIRRLCWAWLTPWFAHDRLARRLGNLHTDYKGLAPRAVVRALHRESVSQGRSWRALALSAYAATFARACAHHDYRQWVTLVESRASRQLSPDLATPQGWPYSHRPLLSVLMPLDAASLATGEEGLSASVASLLSQHYGNWELCLVVDPALPTSLLAFADGMAREHDRIKVWRGRSARFDALSHRAFVVATGEGVLWLTPGDQLAPAALHRVAQAWQRHPNVQLFYADEDKLGMNGQRCQPWFKPQWNPDLLVSQPYIGRLAVYRRNLVWRLQAFATIGEGLGVDATPALLDYAFALRFLAWQAQRPPLEPVAVKHLPYVLYHRHTANVGDEDPQRYSNLVQQLLTCLPAALHAQAMPGPLPSSTRLRWPLPETSPLVSLLVPTRDGVHILRPCVDSLLENTDYRRFELLILDNQSQCPETIAYLDEVQQRDARVRVLRWDHPFNYSAINNFGVAHARGEFIGLVNNDIEPIDSEWLSEMLRQACRPEIGCVGAKLYYPNGVIQHAGVMLGVGGVAGHAHRFFPGDDDGYCGRLKLVQNFSAVTAACLLVKRSVYEQVNGLNEPHLGVAFNDVDFCLRVQQAGYRNLWTPHARLYHHESATRHAPGMVNRVVEESKEAAYMKVTWGQQLNDDPAYNPNLTRAYEDFSLR